MAYQTTYASNPLSLFLFSQSLGVTHTSRQEHIDLIGPLPPTPRGNTVILTVVERLSKAAVFCANKMTVTTAGAAKLFFEQVFEKQTPWHPCCHHF